MQQKNLICPIIIVLGFLFFLLTIRSGQPWPDDFAMYIHEAKNLVEHVPLSETGYIYNPSNPGMGPRSYPPVFPAFLAPAYMIGGLNNLAPMQVEIVVFFSGLLFLLWRGLGAQLALPFRVAMLAVIGFNPLLWTYKDFIVSDIPFAFFLYLALTEADCFITDCEGAAKKGWRILGLAALIYLCYGTRTMGIILIPALVLLAAMYWKRGGRTVAAAATLGLILCLIQLKIVGGEATYADQLRLGFPKLVEAIFHNVVTYTWSLSTFWQNPYAKILRDIIFFSFTLLAAVAYFRRIRMGARIYELFSPLYLSVVLLWPNPAGARYLIPIFPLYVYYGLEGAETLRVWLKIHRVEYIMVPLMGVVLLSYGAEFHRLDFGPFKEGISNKEAQALFSFIKSNTTPKDIFIFRRPRALALFTERSAAVYPLPENDANYCRYFQTIGATYLIEAPALDDPGFDVFLKSENLVKQPVFSNADFAVFPLQADDLKRCANHGISANALPSHLP